MGLFSLEHSRWAYHADFAVYGLTVALLAGGLLWSPPERAPAIAALVALGLASWSLLEYGLHRLVLHGMPPFKHWHALHHARPAALIGTPTLLSGGLVAGLVLLPAWWLGAVWQAVALTLGLLAGYLGYASVHHALHHWRATSAWMQRRQRWHAQHHRAGAAPGCFGVTSSFWDHVFGTAPAGPRR